MKSFLEYLNEEISYGQSSGRDFFSRVKDENISQRIKYLYYSWSAVGSEHYIYAKDNGETIGVACLQLSPYEKNVVWIKFVSIDERYRRMGIATEIIERIFAYAQEKDLILEPSSYSKMGSQYLPKVMKKVSSTHPNVKVRWKDESVVI